MSSAGVEQLPYALDRAFDGDGPAQGHALAGNLQALEPERWDGRPAGCVRSARDLARHVGGALRVYASQAFGDGSVHSNEPESLPGPGPDAGPVERLAWLRESHEVFRAGAAGIADDAGLLVPRRTPQGWERDAHWLAITMIEHETYHAGEINHIRLLIQGNDA